ncbi:hypothetical protein ADL21_37920 [Streptomyces albus subsp. albus]|nr:hypothetical protein ADL21_37920 [Streptomyces albus subsp. albus]
MTGTYGAASMRGLVRYLIMVMRQTLAVLGLTAATVGSGMVTAAPAAAGEIPVFLSPAYTNNCANHGHARTAGGPLQSAGTVNGLLAAVPVSSPTNQCGGADGPKASLQLLLTERGFIG